ncbi:UNVERIFIED_CONTAM: Ubiquitin-like-specific protease ESD4 [Sesamum radiatum]|uniref:Ubiquitin-like-specific protease ESD4 n=1 Tax=Sesamum radiatum TaxID=300843 RepID=A0AAW2UCW5_SESRA
MGALTNNRKRGDDYYKSLVSFSPSIDQSCGHISKKPKLSVPMSEKTPENNLPASSISVVSRISQYPARKSGFPREVHAPVRNSRFGLFSSAKNTETTASSKESPSDNMGRFSFFHRSRQYKQARDAAFRSLRYTSIGKQKEKEVIEVDSEDEIRDDVCDDSSIEENVTEECFVPLTDEEESEISRALSNSNRRKVLVTHEISNIDITGEILQCLRPGAWLNDEVINVYLELLKEREKREPQKFLKCHFFNTFFYKKIFVPIHKEVHWCLAIINKKDEKFQYLDSLKGGDTRVLNVLSRYFVDEVKDKCGKDINVSSWEQEFVTDLPEQANG